MLTPLLPPSPFSLCSGHTVFLAIHEHQRTCPPGDLCACLSCSPELFSPGTFTTDSLTASWSFLRRHLSKKLAPTFPLNTDPLSPCSVEFLFIFHFIIWHSVHLIIYCAYCQPPATGTWPPQRRSSGKLCSRLLSWVPSSQEKCNKY